MTVADTPSQEAADRMLAEVRELPVVRAILKRLETELPPALRYHTASHTQDVLREVVLFSLFEGLPRREIDLLAIAAAYHDSGYLQRDHDNEVLGARIAREEMERAGSYADGDIALVEGMILDTRLVETAHGPRQLPTTPLSKYLLDADLSNLGRKDFFEKGELQRSESGADRDQFLRNTFQLISNHCWHTRAAAELRQAQKERNLEELRRMLKRAGGADDAAAPELDLERLRFLAQLPLLLNSSLALPQVVEVALDEVTRMLGAEAATVFLASRTADELTFWAAKGGKLSLSGRRMPAHKGVVGWAIDNQESVLIPDAQQDPRFFNDFDRESGFITRNIICVPLTVRGSVRVGALQVLNHSGGRTFTAPDLFFTEQFAQQLALALDNAQLYEELDERNRQLETLDRRKNEMITVIAHEFRTPLNVVMSSAELLGSGMLKDAAGVERLSKALQDGVMRLSRLLGQINNISLLSAKAAKPALAPVDVIELLDQTAQFFAAPVASRKLAFAVEKPPAGAAVRADGALLLVVLKNLLSNAIRFTADGGSIALKTAARSGLVEFTVLDTGIGIDQAHLPLIFQKFYEVTDAMQHHSGTYEFRSGGLGLGLATARAILQAHRSDIDVKSELGKGSAFSFRLPLVNV